MRRRRRGCSRLAWEEVHLLELEPGDLHEEPAGARLSAAAAGAGVEVKGYRGGQWTLVCDPPGTVPASAATRWPR